MSDRLQQNQTKNRSCWKILNSTKTAEDEESYDEEEEDDDDDDDDHVIRHLGFNLNPGNKFQNETETVLEWFLILRAQILKSREDFYLNQKEDWDGSDDDDDDDGGGDDDDDDDVDVGDDDDGNGDTIKKALRSTICKLVTLNKYKNK